MPPIRKQDSLESERMEDSIQLALLDLKNKRICSVREAARLYMIPRTTLQNRMNGLQYRQMTRADRHKLTRSEECLQTRQSIRRFIRQSTAIKRHINQSAESPNPLIDQAIIRMTEAYETITNALLLLRKENHDLRAALEKEKQEIAREEAQALVQGQVEVSQAVTTAPAEPELSASQAVVRRQFRCSCCGIKGHKINRCPYRTSN